MKIYLALFTLMISLSANAITLSRYLSSPNGSSEQRFEVSGQEVEFEKLSNYFDTKKNYSLGKFKLAGDTLDAPDIKKLEEILSKIKIIDELIKKKNSSFNELSSKEPHESFLILDDFRISKKSDLYPEVLEIFERFAAKKWDQVSGIQLSEDLKKLTTIKNGKKVSSENFNFPFHCKESNPPSICSFKDLGILFVE